MVVLAEHKCLQCSWKLKRTQPDIINPFKTAVPCKYCLCGDNKDSSPIQILPMWGQALDISVWWKNEFRRQELVVAYVT